MNVYRVLLLFAVAADPQAARVSHKIEIIESGKAKAGTVYSFTVAELNAWARAKAPSVVPQGLREPRLELGNNSATGYALVDFIKMRQGAGEETNWLVTKLIQGEKRVKVMAQHSIGQRPRHGHLLQRVEIGGSGGDGHARSIS